MLELLPLLKLRNEILRHRNVEIRNGGLISRKVFWKMRKRYRDTGPYNSGIRTSVFYSSGKVGRGRG
jgi:hypothetical protein